MWEQRLILGGTESCIAQGVPSSSTRVISRAASGMAVVTAGILGYCWRVMGIKMEGATSSCHGTCWTASTSCRAGLLSVYIAVLMLYHWLEQHINSRPETLQA